jgi:putative two-component system response regulator
MNTTTGRPRVSRILVVDDNPSVSGLLRRVLETEGYLVEVAEDGRSALARVSIQPPDLILLDLDLPLLAGDEICRRLKQDPTTRLIPIVIVTGQGACHNRLEAWENGADEFLSKPFHLAEVTARCRSLLRIKRLVEERDSAEAVVFALARAVEAKSPYTHGHSERVTRYALALTRALNLPDGQKELLRKGGRLHDIGKICVPDAVLNKPGALTPEEFEVIKQHPDQGAHIVGPLLTLRDAVPLIRWHHERMDGKGYPDGLHGNEIPLLVRVLSVADVFDSLSSDRPYRRAMPLDACFQLLRNDAASGGLDPDLVASFCDLIVASPTGPTLIEQPEPLERPYSPGLHDTMPMGAQTVHDGQ